MKRYLIPTALGLFVPIAVAALGLTKMLGAHIWWDVETILIGAPIGVLLATALSLVSNRRAAHILGFLALTLLAFAAARYGQIQFAASYGDDRLAGTFWYFGWIGVGIGFSGLIASFMCR